MDRKGEIEQILVIRSSHPPLSVENTDVPVEVRSILDKFSVMFAEPSGLPPRRACDHQIPLIAGAQPVQVRPYRHTPVLKDEVERQVAELLKSGVIQESTSAFASPADKGIDNRA
jgi:hypothetical protein